MRPWRSRRLGGRAQCSTTASATTRRRWRRRSGRASHRDLGYADWSLAELILAAVRVAGTSSAPAGALQQLSSRAHDCQSEWALGIEARCRALLSDETQAEHLYGEAIERLGRTRIRVELAHTHLQYGEWLRRQRRKLEARKQLRTAHEMFTRWATRSMPRALSAELRPPASASAGQSGDRPVT